ncbi:hypothetical protein AHiyo8_pI68550 (plasmid) [Arthrobacter sp. Hiyo8]|nr:hypothetical protein AHiyo8_pI68550 [Arthrobacter sp. Hiyo8]
MRLMKLSRKFVVGVSVFLLLALSACGGEAPAKEPAARTL